MPLWIPIGLLAVLLWVTGNIIDKYLVERYAHDHEDDTDMDTLFMFSSLFAIPTLILALCLGGSIETAGMVKVTGIVAGLLFGLYLFLYLRALGRSELSRIIPIFQSIPLFGFVFAWIMLGETITRGEMIAGAIILIGSAIISYHHSKERFDTLSFLFILIGSASIALQETLFKHTALSTDYWTGILWSSVGLFLFGLVIYVIRPQGRAAFNRIFAHRRFALIGTNTANEVLDNTASLVFSFAILIGPIVLVQSMNAYQPLIILIVAFVAQKLNIRFLSEDMTFLTLGQKVIGIGFIFVGSLLLYYPMFTAG